MITIGKQFAEERKHQGLTIEEVSKATKIRPEFLEAIEKGDYKSLPGSSYAHGFVRNYAKFLGLPVEKSLAIFRREFNAEKSFDVLPRGFSAPSDKRFKKVNLGRNVLIIAGIFSLIFGFILFQYRAAFLNPTLSVYSPKENETIKSLAVLVKGKTDPDITLFIEGEGVVVNPDGTFSSEISLFPGKSTIKFIAENRFGRKTEKRIDVVISP